MGFLSSVTRGLEAVATGGISEFAQSNPFGVPGASSYMPMVLGGAAGTLLGNPAAGISLGSSVFSAMQQAQAVDAANRTNQAIAQGQMNFSAAQAREQMAFQERMSDTVYQRGAQDLQKAGINPMLAAGAPDPMAAGAMAQSAGTQVQPVPSVVANSISSAKDLISTLQSLKESDSRIAANKASAGLSAASADTKATEGYVSTILKKVLQGFVGSAKQTWNDAKSIYMNVSNAGLGSPLAENPGGQ